MKKWIIASGILIMISGSSFAQQKRNQEKRTPEERAMQMTERLSKELSLTESQKAEILALQKQHAKQRESARSNQQKERESHHSQIQEILTDEQRTKWVELKDDRKAHQRGRPGGEIHSRLGHGKRGSSRGN